MKELICIVCPNGCHLKVDEENGYNVTGNKCERGAEYGKAELLYPMRMVTSTVRIEGASCRSKRAPPWTKAGSSTSWRFWTACASMHPSTRAT